MMIYRYNTVTKTRNKMKDRRTETIETEKDKKNRAGRMICHLRERQRKTEKERERQRKIERQRKMEKHSLPLPLLPPFSPSPISPPPSLERHFPSM